MYNSSISVFFLTQTLKSRVSINCVLCLVSQSCLTLCNPMDRSPPGSPVHGDSPGKNTGVGCHALLQGIFSTQGSNPGLSHCRRILFPLSHQGSPRILEWVACSFSGDLPNPGIKLGSPALQDRKSTRLNSSHSGQSRMPSSA